MGGGRQNQSNIKELLILKVSEGKHLSVSKTGHPFEL